MEPSDAHLVEAAGCGDAAAFTVLVSRHYDRIFRVAYRVLGRVEEAEDLAQDVCAGLAAKLRSYRRDARFTTWLHSVVINAARDRLRRQATQRRAAEGWAHVEPMRRAEAAAAEADRTWLAAAMQTLSEDLRETVAMVLGEEMTHAEAAVVLGVSEGTVSWRMSEVRKRLRAMAEAEERI